MLKKARTRNHIPKKIKTIKKKKQIVSLYDLVVDGNLEKVILLKKK